MRWTDSMVGSIGLPEASGGMRCTERFRSRGVRRGATGALWAAPRETSPQTRASQWLSKGKTTRKSHPAVRLHCSFFLPAQRGEPNRWLSWRECATAGVAGSGAVLPSMSLPLSLSLFSLQRIPVSQRPDCRASFNGLPGRLSGTGYLQDQDGRPGARGPAADWSFVRLTGFRSSIRALGLWGVQSCIGVCFARLFSSRARVCARGHALVGRHGTQ